MIAAVLGGGVIGAGWAARFLLNGHDVRLYDPDPEIERKTLAVLDNARRAQRRLLGALLPPEGRLTFAGSVAAAVADADFVQESLPEIETLKQRVLGEIDAHARAEVVIASSTSGLLPTRLQEGLRYPERFVVGHPFNPVYLLPLVEICGGERTGDAARQTAAKNRELWASGQNPEAREVKGPRRWQDWLERDGRAQSPDNFVGRRDDHEPVGGRRDDLLAQVRAVPPFDGPAVVGDLVGAVDREVETVELVEGFHRDAQGTGCALGVGRRGPSRQL